MRSTPSHATSSISSCSASGCKQGCTIVFVTHSIAEAAFLGDRILLLSPRPGRIDTEIVVPFPRPRPTSIQMLPEFQAIVQRLRERLEAIT